MAWPTHWKKTCGIIVGGYLVLIAGVLLCPLWFQFTEQRDRWLVADLAQQLGNDEQHQITLSTTHDDLASASAIIAFTTPKAFATFRQDVAALGLPSTSSIYPSRNFERYELDDAIEHSGKQLIHIQNDSPPENYRWVLKNKQGRKIYLGFYETSGADQKYLLDGQLMHGNIVIIAVPNH